ASSYVLASLFNVSNRDIVGSYIVGIMRISAYNTSKCRLRSSVGFVYVAASARSGCVAGIYRFDFDAMFAPDVFDLGEQRRKRPSVHNQSLLPARFDSRANAFQVFNRNRPRAGSQGFFDDLIPHIPEQPIHRPLLFARQPFQESSLASALVPCGL